MSIKLRDIGTNKFIMDYDETAESVMIHEYQPGTFSKAEGEWLYDLKGTRYIQTGGTFSSGTIYGAFYDDTTQTTATASFALPMRFPHKSEGVGIEVVNGDALKIGERGTYNFQFSAQIDQSSGSGNHIYIWFRKNGTDIPWSASEVAIQGTSAETIPSWNFIYTLQPGDEFQVMWSATSDVVQLKAVSPSSPVPGIPSVIMTAVKIA